MKILVTLAVAGALLLTTVTSALASHGATTVSAPVPAHGSVWHGTGLDRYDVAPDTLLVHDSALYGGGPDRYFSESATVSVYGNSWYGGGPDRYNTVTVPVHANALYGEALGH